MGEKHEGEGGGGRQVGPNLQRLARLEAHCLCCEGLPCPCTPGIAVQLILESPTSGRVHHKLLPEVENWIAQELILRFKVSILRTKISIVYHSFGVRVLRMLAMSCFTLRQCLALLSDL